MQTLTFAIDGNTGALQIFRSGLLLAELNEAEQLHLLAGIAQAHLQRLEHIRVNGQGPRPVLAPVTNPVG